jgi:hypothetical protein
VTTAAETDSPRDGSSVLLRLAPVAWLLAAVAAATLLLYAVPRQEEAPLKAAAVLFAVCGGLWVFPSTGKAGRRALLSLFLLAFAVRLLAAVLFDSLASRAQDPFAGSPDAWGYDLWARRLVSAWSHLRTLTVSSYDAAGRWDVGFHYVLAVSYSFFGESVLGARLLVACFGAAAVVFFYLIVRRLAGASVGVFAGLLYAFWISSVAWSGFTVLRDSLVWALTFAAVWLALRVADGSGWAGLALFLCLLLLRTVRPYAEALVVAGIAAAGLFAALRRPRAVLRPALIAAGAVLAVEAVLFAAGFPTMLQMVHVYQPRQVLLKPLKEVPLSEISGYPAAPTPTAVAAAASVRVQPFPAASVPVRPPVARVASAPARVPAPAAAAPAPVLDGEARPVGPPPRLFGPSLPANALRFFLSPPGWAPVRGDVAHSDNWQLPGMWLWYAILPVAALGFFLSLRGSPALQSLTITTLAFALVLVLVGRGDSARQREMVVPVFLLWFVIGVGPALRRPRRLLAIYLLYFAILAAGIVYHRGTMRERGMVRLESPCEGPSRNESSRCSVFESSG